jgi:hypothetical protein
MSIFITQKDTDGASDSSAIDERTLAPVADRLADA